MRNNALRKKLAMAGVLILAIFFAIAAERLLGNYRSVRTFVYKTVYSLQEETLTRADYEVVGYQTDGDHFIVEKNDPTLYFATFNRNVATIEITFQQPVPEGLRVVAYYTTAAGEGFSEGKSCSAMISEENPTAKLSLYKNVQQLRLDIADESGESFDLASIVVNPSFDASMLWKGFLQGTSADRFVICFLAFLFLGLHLLIPPKKIYAFMFRYRWAIMGAFVLVMTLMHYHGSSIGMYDRLIQPGMGSDYIEPVIGAPRAIRSDEWLVSTPGKLSTRFLDPPFSKVNDILRGTATNARATTGLCYSLSMFCSPISLLYYVDIELGFCFSWWMRAALCFMVSIELCYILTRRTNKLAAVMGGALIGLSPYYFWWSFNPNWLWTGQAILVCCYYFIHAEKTWQRILLGLGIAFSGTSFITTLYPAWQVPSGYLFALIFLWMVIDNFAKIKTFRRKEWALFGGALALGLCLVGFYLLDTIEYTKTITTTVYPGNRLSTGGMSLKNLFLYPDSIFYPWRDVGNPSEYGAIINLYPLPTLLALYYWIRSKKKDLLCTLLLLYSAVLTVFCTVGFPTWLAKITLFSYSPEERALNILAVLQVYLLVMVMTRYRDVPKPHPVLGGIFAAVVGALAFWVPLQILPNYLPKRWLFLIAAVIAAVAFVLSSVKKEKIVNSVMIALIVVTVASSCTVHPLMKGFDVIDSKPVAQKIMEIREEDPDAKWIFVGGLAYNGFLPSCGVKTINYVNHYPNWELWEILDPDGEYEYCYNRYAHMQIVLTEEETSVELVQEDAMKLYLSYCDLERIGVRYLASTSQLKSGGGVTLEEIYAESGVYLYQVMS